MEKILSYHALTYFSYLCTMKRVISEHIRQQVAALPHSPGVYQFVDSQGKIIYVGKAKNLRNRLKSYFTGRTEGKTKKLVSEIDHFEYIVTDSEAEALILECNLIKENRPKFNVLLKDDKTYPYIVLTKEINPRLLYTRDIKKIKGKVFLLYFN